MADSSMFVITNSDGSNPRPVPPWSPLSGLYSPWMT